MVCIRSFVPQVLLMTPLDSVAWHCLINEQRRSEEAVNCRSRCAPLASFSFERRSVALLMQLFASAEIARHIAIGPEHMRTACIAHPSHVYLWSSLVLLRLLGPDRWHYRL